MGKCLSCCKEDQSFQRCSPEDQVSTDAQHRGASSVSQPSISLGHKTSYSPVTHKVNSAKASRRLLSVSSPSFSERRCSLFVGFQKRNASPYWQQSRANFDSEEDTSFTDLKSSSDHCGSFMSRRRRFSSHKLSIVSYYKSAIFFDPQASGQNVFNLNEIKIFSKTSSNTDAKKHITISAPEYNTKNFKNFETNTTSPAFGNTIDTASYQQSTSSFFSLASDISSPDQQNGIATDIQQRGQLCKDLKDFLHPGPESYSTDHSPIMIPQHPSQSGTFPFLHKAGFSSSYKNSGCFIPPQSELTSGPFEDEDFAVLFQDEDRSSPIEIPKIRYITANTDTEEQSFPVPKAFNTHVEELNLDVLLQKVDHLRMSESGKSESFELLRDHKEKFRDEIEFMWRFARAYGDMYELSTNTQEKKHYANIGKTLSERAINRAPMNGHCHLWYAVLCGYVSEFEGLQNKINYGHLFKVSKLSWIEKKMAATLFGKIPSSTVQEALHNFLKAEELCPGYSNPNYMYLAKCYTDLEENQNALKFCNLALLLPTVTKEDKEAQKEMQKIMTSLKSFHSCPCEETTKQALCEQQGYFTWVQAD
ncbi:regulator of microtubule dynamics protein 2 isoform X3 [Pan troglodytes]|uniref:regulator of microtubule dynamics protein 2 isoform X3 n=1 Tax=Pan troglodytes TaxID=9598 RepID=UPI0023F4AEAF|nr:regulator of microtubule dynamics protein 2 isoform X3 [Pan troglodytes]